MENALRFSSLSEWLEWRRVDNALLSTVSLNGSKGAVSAGHDRQIAWHPHSIRGALKGEILRGAKELSVAIDDGLYDLYRAIDGELNAHANEQETH
ncbi:hypothetical protein D3C81_1279000 [compost metagenome]